MRSLILETAARFLAPLLVLFSIFLLLRGHHRAGGGFAGGLLATIAFALLMLSSGRDAARRSLPLDPHVLIGGGLLVAALSGLAPLLVDLPLFTGIWIPAGAGETPHYGSPLQFDIGVYLVVTGIGVLILHTVSED